MSDAICVDSKKPYIDVNVRRNAINAKFCLNSNDIHTVIAVLVDSTHDRDWLTQPIAEFLPVCGKMCGITACYSRFHLTPCLCRFVVHIVLVNFVKHGNNLLRVGNSNMLILLPYYKLGLGLISDIHISFSV